MLELRIEPGLGTSPDPNADEHGGREQHGNALGGKQRYAAHYRVLAQGVVTAWISLASGFVPDDRFAQRQLSSSPAIRMAPPSRYATAFRPARFAA